MLDFGPIRRHELSLSEFARRLHITRDDLIRHTNDMIDAQLHLIAGIEDADVVFTPVDPEADDPFAGDAGDAALAWTLGHVIVHVTASGEETCAHSSILARGVQVHGRCRYETPWEQMQTAAQLRQRLEESRRIRLAYLGAWPDAPHFDQTYTPYKTPHNCVTRVLAGLFHDDDHLDQINDIIRQAAAARTVLA